ncbi:C40 family peptidase [Helicobacter pylori]|uniref:C40 family peptidase n=1 Tax=Helicobacter pylori TaxID=210 RepID=UPI00287BABDD|nr:SH3 domain-containing protein [Helicobacter pylori]WNE32694.1 NlpC/P60 family protein [Helicobacter pylori]WNE34122.1 NlpC/P60 family protein [Helicobacter pylori]WNE35548.1 NlpC/P60 family protein [Helicobacter pylori]WNE36976.1 NlpC/P60 family protein [Helicobacter pylori]WNE38401.1 NlpC/P60 family protein [Helicobacter pylori]
MRYFLVVFLFLFVGCTKKDFALKDLSLPQEASSYLASPQNGSNNNQSIDSQALRENLKESYLKAWYSPWLDAKVKSNKKEVFWILKEMNKSTGYGEDLKPNAKALNDELIKSMDIEHYPSVKIKAVVTRDSDVRAVPTNKPFYLSPKGYPFDRYQNSLIFQGTPVLITHFNTDKTYAHIQSSFVYGWIKVSDLAYMRDKDIELLTHLKDYVMPIKDKIPLYTGYGDFYTNARVGELFALIPQSQKTPEKSPKKELKAYGFLRDAKGYAALQSVILEEKDFFVFPKAFTSENMAYFIDTMLGQKYGWGGLLGNRDCSAFTRDSFANFGILLPRNSYAQSRYANNYVDLSSMKAKEKEDYILKNATPFGTLIYLKGHIMLYLGAHNHQAIVAHSIWSVQTQKHFKTLSHKIGGVVITSLWLAEEHNGAFSKKKLLIDRVLGMSDLKDFVNKTSSPLKAN